MSAQWRDRNPLGGGQGETVKGATEEDFLCIEIQKGRELENQKRIRERLGIHS